MNDDLKCTICNNLIYDDEDAYEYHHQIMCEDCLFDIFLKENNFDKRTTQDDMNDDDFFIWDRFREDHLID